MKQQTTTIQIPKKLKVKLDYLKLYPSETYSEVIETLLGFVPKGDEEGEYTDEFRLNLLRARMEMQAGKTVPLAKVKKELGL